MLSYATTEAPSTFVVAIAELKVKKGIKICDDGITSIKTPECILEALRKKVV
jgi:hypothetical protein